MFFWIWAILGSWVMSSVVAPPSPNRDYMNNIGIICSYDKTNSGSVYSYIGEGTKIGQWMNAFGKKRKVIFYISGYGEDINPDDDDGSMLESFVEFTRAFLIDNQTVACAFDFVHKKNAGAFKMLKDYRSSVLKRVPFAAKMISNVASEMYNRRILDKFEDLQLIGFSLGTHIAGKVGRLLRTAYGVTIPRIFALDPAKTFTFDSENQLKKTDALCVQALFSSKLSQQNIDVDCKIYVNNGSQQPGCGHLRLVNQVFCSHNFLPKLYEDALNEGKKLVAYRDPDKNRNDRTVPKEMVVGHLAKKCVKGVFYLNTDGTTKKKARGWKFMGLVKGY